MASDNADASASVTWPAAYAFHKSAETAGSSARGDASTARRSCSTNMISPPDQRPAREGLSRHHRITDQASPLWEMIVSHLTKGRVFGESQIAKSRLSRLRPDVRAAPQAARFISGL